MRSRPKQGDWLNFFLADERRLAFHWLWLPGLIAYAIAVKRRGGLLTSVLSLSISPSISPRRASVNC
jgi:hypothetical protein